MPNKITATPAAPHAVSFCGKEYQFTASTTATRAERVSALLRRYEAGEDTRPELAACLHETTLTGKLEGLCSTSTSCLDNSRCDRLSRCPGLICTECYARKELAKGIRRTLREHAEINGWILKTVDFSTNHLKAAPLAILQQYHRIESHGETDNATQATNYIHLAEAKSETVFAVWSKQLEIWVPVFEQYGKPKNLIFVYSSPRLNEPAPIPARAAKWIDHRFTVYDLQHAPEIKSAPCGMKCRDCITAGQNCYFRPTPANFDIAETLK